MASLSKNKIKYIHSLELKKIRKEERVFLAEGPKLVGDLLGHFPCRFLAATPSWFQEHPGIDANELVEVSQEDLSRASLLKTPQQVLAIFNHNILWIRKQSANRFVLHWTMCRIPEIWVPLSVWPTGLASNILSARRIR